eukprot:TRINITY_DN1117_c0_g2_i1.p1 TRINITY_DN1117_c0_g2~~TRINITY_DN1117_c0_g2_i1.p1  ORF type:complete len:519 (-),score=175.48 TRINITY_DN1117_c0_g2_i1:1559-3115(-)
MSGNDNGEEFAHVANSEAAALLGRYRRECEFLGLAPSQAILFYLYRLERQVVARPASDAGAGAVPATVNSVDLSYSSIDSKAVIPLALTMCASECEGVSTLVLAFNLIEATGAQAIAKMLVGQKHITNLDLSGNPLGDQGIAVIAQSLTDKNCALKKLVLNSTRISDAGAAHIIDAIDRSECLEAIDTTGNLISTTKQHEIDSAMRQHVDTLDMARFRRDLEATEATNSPALVEESDQASAPFEKNPPPSRSAWHEPVFRSDNDLDTAIREDADEDAVSVTPGGYQSEEAESSSMMGAPSFRVVTAEGSSHAHRRWSLRNEDREVRDLHTDTARLRQRVSELKELINIKDRVIHKTQEDLRKQGVKHREQLRVLSNERIQAEKQLRAELEQQRQAEASLRASLLGKEQQVVQLQHTVEHLQYVKHQQLRTAHLALQVNDRGGDAGLSWKVKFEDLQKELALRQKQQTAELRKVYQDLQQSREKERELAETAQRKVRDCEQLRHELRLAQQQQQQPKPQ